MQLTQIIARAIHEPEFRSRLISQPKQVLQEMSVPIPQEQAVTVVESRNGTIFFVIPIMSEEEIQQLSTSVNSVHPQRSVRSRILLKATQDPGYKAELFKHPKAILKTEGLPIPDAAEVTVLENSLEQLYIVLPHVHTHQHSHQHS